jgi:hypothetical protein
VSITNRYQRLRIFAYPKEQGQIRARQSIFIFFDKYKKKQTNKLTKGDIVFCRSVTFAAFYTPDRFLKPVRCGVTAPTIFVFHL